MPILVPVWMKGYATNTRADRCIRNRYFIKSAALAYGPSGLLEDLAAGLGMPYSSLVTVYAPRSGNITPEFAVKLEKFLGADVLPRKLLRPDVFG